MGVRAGIVVTGTEVLTGRVADRNGPWLAEALREHGVDVGQIVVVGDRPGDMRSALGFLAAWHDLVITSGGLGPTADDLTAQIVAEFQGRPLHLDPSLEERVGAIVARLSARFGSALDPSATAAAVRKQSMVPDGATVLEPTGTAPGLVVPPADGASGPPVIVLPGPPRELQAMWPAALLVPSVAGILASATELRQRTLRLWNVPESELAAMLRRSGSALDDLEITTCLNNGELEIVSRYSPAAETAYRKLADDVRKTFGDKLFSEGPTVDEIVATGLAERGWTIAAGEAGLGGHTTARLATTLGPAFLGGVVSSELPGLTPEWQPGDLDATVTKVIYGALRTFDRADVGIGIAGPRDDGQVVIAIGGSKGTSLTSSPVRGPAEFVRQRVSSLVLHQLRTWLASAHD